MLGATLAALALSASPCGLPPLRGGALPWRPGEAMVFDVDVMGVVKAGTLSLAVEPPILKGALVPIRARVRNSSVFAKVRRLRGYALTWLDVRTMRPQRYRDEVDDDGLRRTTDTRLDRGGATVAMAWTSGESHGTTDFERRDETLDLLSMIYLLRAADPKPGEDLCFDLVANRRYWRVRGRRATGTERVESEAGVFETYRIDFTLTRADDPSKTRPLHLWYSTDARRLLVAVVSEIDLGPVRAMLTSSGRAPPP